MHNPPHHPTIEKGAIDSAKIDSATIGSDLGEARTRVGCVRAVQVEWNQLAVAERLRIMARVAPLVAQHAESLAEAVMRPSASTGEILASEVLPLAEAVRYMARCGRAVLGGRDLPARHGAWWMGSIRVREVREPFGVVLVIGPSNYPLLLPGVQALQALAAGNGVLIKPAPGCAAALERLLELCVEAGVPAGLAAVLPSSPAAAQSAMRAGVDKVIFTGSYETGQAVARTLAEAVTPAVLELSGSDAVFVLDDADLDRVGNAVVYALDLNAGQTCIAPRRLFATRHTLQQLVPRVRAAIATCQPRAIQAKAGRFASEAIAEALADGAQMCCGQWPADAPLDLPALRPVVLSGVTSNMRVALVDLFAPVLSLIEVDSIETALVESRRCRYALGAAVFGSTEAAQRIASQVSAGCVTVNDILVPTADPRVSFGGWQASGYGVTRGLEGLKELTRLKVICQRRGRWLPHLSTRAETLAPLMRGLLLLRHGRSFRDRWAACRLLMKSLRK